LAELIERGTLVTLWIY